MVIRVISYSGRECIIKMEDRKLHSEGAVSLLMSEPVIPNQLRLFSRESIFKSVKCWKSTWESMTIFLTSSPLPSSSPVYRLKNLCKYLGRTLSHVALPQILTLCLALAPWCAPKLGGFMLANEAVLSALPTDGRFWGIQ